MGIIVMMIVLAIPVLLTGWNIFALIQYLVKKKERKHDKVTEIIAICIGVIYLFIYGALSDIAFVNWDIQLYNTSMHSMIKPDNFLTIGFIILVAFIGYILIRFIRADKQSPIVSVVGISAMYLGIGICLLWSIQTISDFILIILPINCIIIFVKTIFILVYEKNNLIQSGVTTTKYKKLSTLLNKSTNLPWLALILMIPLFGIIISILFLFGQEPNSIIKAWTETADWTMSQKIAPQNIQYDEHYLCTVAAGGHRKVVKPIRTGMRHGHRVLVNRQLCIANAFEQVIQEKLPVFHKLVRFVYDRTGYPISKHIHSKYLADIIYILMKPLEWLFLLVIYTVDVNPENRIAVQYPHTKIQADKY